VEKRQLIPLKTNRVRKKRSGEVLQRGRRRECCCKSPEPRGRSLQRQGPEKTSGGKRGEKKIAGNPTKKKARWKLGKQKKPGSKKTKGKCKIQPKKGGGGGRDRQKRGKRLELLAKKREKNKKRSLKTPVRTDQKKIWG